MKIAVDRLGDILNTATEPQFNPGRATLPTIKGDIRFEGVAFRYAPNTPEVLRGIDLHITPGQRLGIVGSSGSGKSTLTKLVQRLHVPDSGRVLVDGVDLAQVDPSWLRRQVGVVLQENRLFNRTIRDNIALAEPHRRGLALRGAAAAPDAAEGILDHARLRRQRLRHPEPKHPVRARDAREPARNRRGLLWRAVEEQDVANEVFRGGRKRSAPLDCAPLLEASKVGGDRGLGGVGHRAECGLERDFAQRGEVGW